MRNVQTPADSNRRFYLDRDASPLEIVQPVKGSLPSLHGISISDFRCETPEDQQFTKKANLIPARQSALS
jgi:hypothetical protein